MRDARFDPIQIAIWFNEDDRRWEWEVRIGQYFFRAGYTGSRSAAYRAADDTIGAASVC